MFLEKVIGYLQGGLIMTEKYGLCTMCREKPAEYEPYYARSDDNFLCKEWDCWAEWMSENTHEIGDY